MGMNQISREGPNQLQFLELQGSRQDLEFSKLVWGLLMGFGVRGQWATALLLSMLSRTDRLWASHREAA